VVAEINFRVFVDFDPKIDVFLQVVFLEGRFDFKTVKPLYQWNRHFIIVCHALSSVAATNEAVSPSDRTALEHHREVKKGEWPEDYPAMVGFEL